MKSNEDFSVYMSVCKYSFWQLPSQNSIRKVKFEFHETTIHEIRNLARISPHALWAILKKIDISNFNPKNQIRIPWINDSWNSNFNFEICHLILSGIHCIHTYIHTYIHYNPRYDRAQPKCTERPTRNYTSFHSPGRKNGPGVFLYREKRRRHACIVREWNLAMTFRPLHR